jgi:hypothetical protein
LDRIRLRRVVAGDGPTLAPTHPVPNPIQLLDHTFPEPATSSNLEAKRAAETANASKTQRTT